MVLSFKSSQKEKSTQHAKGFAAFKFTRKVLLCTDEAVYLTSENHDPWA